MAAAGASAGAVAGSVSPGPSPMELELELEESPFPVDLPDDCVLSILGHLPRARDRGAMALVCRHWCRLEAGSRRRLRVGPGLHPADQALSALTGRFRGLTSVHLDYLGWKSSSGPQVGDTAVQLLVSRCPALQELSFSFCGFVTDAGLASLSLCPTLRSLRLNFTPCITGRGLLSVVLGCPQLEELHVERCMGLRSSEWLEALGTTHTLTPAPVLHIGRREGLELALALGPASAPTTPMQSGPLGYPPLALPSTPLVLSSQGRDKDFTPPPLGGGSQQPVSAAPGRRSSCSVLREEPTSQSTASSGGRCPWDAEDSERSTQSSGGSRGSGCSGSSSSSASSLRHSFDSSMTLSPFSAASDDGQGGVVFKGTPLVASSSSSSSSQVFTSPFPGARTPGLPPPLLELSPATPQAFPLGGRPGAGLSGSPTPMALDPCTHEDGSMQRGGPAVLAGGGVGGGVRRLSIVNCRGIGEGDLARLGKAGWERLEELRFEMDLHPRDVLLPSVAAFGGLVGDLDLRGMRRISLGQCPRVRGEGLALVLERLCSTQAQVQQERQQRQQQQEQLQPGARSTVNCMPQEGLTELRLLSCPGLNDGDIRRVLSSVSGTLRVLSLSLVKWLGGTAVHSTTLSDAQGLVQAPTEGAVVAASLDTGLGQSHVVGAPGMGPRVSNLQRHHRNQQHQESTWAVTTASLWYIAEFCVELEELELLCRDDFPSSAPLFHGFADAAVQDMVANLPRLRELRVGRGLHLSEGVVQQLREDHGHLALHIV